MDKGMQEKSDLINHKFGSVRTACEIVGKSRLIVENHCGILSYSLCCIHVRTEYGSMQILGDSLSFDFMSRTRLLIKGNVTDIKLIDRGCE